MLKYLIKEMHEELEGAENYAKKALKLKDENKSFATTFYKMAEQEIGHYQNLKEMLEETLQSKGEDMGVKEIIDYECEKCLDELKEVKILMNLYVM